MSEKSQLQGGFSLSATLLKLKEKHDVTDFANPEQVLDCEKVFSETIREAISVISNHPHIVDTTLSPELKQDFQQMAARECEFCQLTPHAELGMDNTQTSLPLLSPILTKEFLDLL